MSSLYEVSVKDAKGNEKAMGSYKGETLLVVNVASKCGFTPQYKGLEALHLAYAQKGLRIMGFPSNDFGAQEPGTIEEIKEFCSINYGVTFEIMDKVHAKGEEKDPIYAWLTSHSEPAGDVKWNFEKFLIGKDGSVVGRFASKITPEDPSLIEAIEGALE